MDINKAEYDTLRKKALILDIVERTIRNESNSVFGYSSDTRVILEAVLGIERKEKAD